MSRLTISAAAKTTILAEVERVRNVEGLIPAEIPEHQKVVWALFGTEGSGSTRNRSKELKLFETGETFPALQDRLSSATNRMYFAFVRFYVLDLYKWILLSWCGPQCSMILRGQCFSYINHVKTEFDLESCVVHICTKPNEFGIDEVMFKIKKSAGSNYCG